MNRQELWIRASVTLYVFPTDGERSDMKSDGATVRTSSSKIPVAILVVSSRPREIGSDSVNRTPEGCESSPPVPSKTANSVPRCEPFCRNHCDQMYPR